MWVSVFFRVEISFFCLSGDSVRDLVSKVWWVVHSSALHRKHALVVCGRAVVGIDLEGIWLYRVSCCGNKIGSICNMHLCLHFSVIL